jgi:hypothetical protein
MDPLSILASSPARAQLMRATGMLGSGGYGRDAADYMPEEQQETMLAAMQRQAGGTLGAITTALDTTGAIGRGVLAGQPLSGFTFDEDKRVSGAELLEKYGVLGKDANPYYRAFAGLAAEIATDPLAIVTGPLSTLSKAGKAAKAAGILNHASDAALAAMGIDKARDTLVTGRNAYQFLGDLLPAGKAITKENAAYRPLVGPRVARSNVTLDQTIQASTDPVKALADVQRYLGKQGLAYDAVKDQKLGGAFGINYFNLHDPIVFNPQSPLAQRTLDLLDAGGQMARWSTPVRGASALFDQRVGGRSGAYDQLMNLRHWDKTQAEKAAARVEASDLTRLVNDTVLPDEAQRLLGATSLNSPQGGDFLTRMFEDVPTQGDMRLRSAIGAEQTDKIVESYNAFRSGIRSQAKDLGMVSRRMQDPYGVTWLPRRGQELKFDDYGKGLSQNAYYTRSLENEVRNKNLMVPGGTSDLRQITLLPKVQQFVREGEKSGLSVAEVGTEIKRFLDYKHGKDTPEARAYLAKLGLEYDPRATPFQTFVPQLDSQGQVMRAAVLDEAGNPKLTKVRTKRGGVRIDKATGQPMTRPKMRTVFDENQVISQKQAEGIARVYMRKDPSLPADLPLFSEHPLTPIARAAQSQAVARANAMTVYQSLAESAVYAGDGQFANAVAGAARRPLDRAITEIAQKTGLQTLKSGDPANSVLNKLKADLAALNNTTPDKINLAQWSVPEVVTNRLSAVHDFYSKPRVQEEVSGIFNAIGQIYKGFLLAFPSRFTRDILSNGYQLWTLGRNPADVVYGLRTAQALVSGNKDAAAQLLRQLPGQASMPAEQLLANLSQDVARTGILQTLASSDLLTANRSAELNSLVPGMTPQRGLDFVKELVPDGSRNPLQMAQDYFTFKGARFPGQKLPAAETRNAVLNASQKLNDYTDSVSRLGGMIMLMKQGVSADEAARRVTTALVDYSSLTPVERSVFKTIFPWWSYSSRSGAYAVNELLTSPGGAYAQTIRGFNRLQESDDETYVPESLRQQGAIRIPDEYKKFLGLGKSGTTTFLRDFDIPGFDVLSTFSPGPGIYPTVKSTITNLAQQTNPLIQNLTELVFDRDLFSRRPLQQSDNALDRIYRELSGSKTNMNPVLRQAIDLIPAPRISSVISPLVDSRIPDMQSRVSKMLINSLAGVKVQDVDPRYQLSDARRILAEELGDYTRDYAESYIPKDVLPQVPEELLPKYALFRSLGKRLRDERKAQ